MNKLLAILVATACVAGATAAPASYSTEATMTRHKDQGTYEVVVRVSRLVAQGGKITEDLVQQPRIKSAPGVAASLYCGLQPSDHHYAKRENVSVEVSWPEPGKQDFAVCTVVVKMGDKIVSKTKTRVTVAEP